MADNKEEIIVDFGNVAPWRFPNNVDKLLKKKVEEVMALPGVSPIATPNGVTSKMPKTVDVAL